jgi:hypothetical protein
MGKGVDREEATVGGELLAWGCGWVVVRLGRLDEIFYKDRWVILLCGGDLMGGGVRNANIVTKILNPRSAYIRALPIEH